RICHAAVGSPRAAGAIAAVVAIRDRPGLDDGGTALVERHAAGAPAPGAVLGCLHAVDPNLVTADADRATEGDARLVKVGAGEVVYREGDLALDHRQVGRP